MSAYPEGKTSPPAPPSMSVRDQLRRLLFEAGVVAAALDAGDSPSEFTAKLAGWGIQDRRGGGSAEKRREARERREEMALLALIRHPDWSNVDIAESIGVSPTWMSRNRRVQAFRVEIAREAAHRKFQKPLGTSKMRAMAR